MKFRNASFGHLLVTFVRGFSIRKLQMGGEADKPAPEFTPRPLQNATPTARARPAPLTRVAGVCVFDTAATEGSR